MGIYPSRGEGEDSLNRPGIIIYHRGKDPLEKMLFFTVWGFVQEKSSDHGDETIVNGETGEEDKAAATEVSEYEN